MPYLRLHYKKIHYADWKPKSGGAPRETFVFVHGLGSSQNYYTAVVPHLQGENYRCVCLDTTGQGRSPYTGVEQDTRSLATDIVDAMDQMSITKAVVVGHSMAGITVPRAAELFPDRISAMVLLGPVYPTTDAHPTFHQRIEAVEKDGMQPMADTVPYGAVGPSAKPLHHAFIRELVLASQPDGYVSMCRVIVGSTEPQNKPDYKKIKVPTLIIAGDEDKSAPPQQVERLHSELGTPSGEKQLVMMKGIGHWMCVETPERCAEEIIKFFKAAQ